MNNVKYCGTGVSFSCLLLYMNAWNSSEDRLNAEAC